MHSPAFFLSLLALCALPLNAVPLQKRDGAAALPAYNQPESTKLDLGITFPALAARDSASANIDAVATTAASALAKSLSITPDEIKVSHAHTDSISGIHHIHFVQVMNGVQVANAVANVNILPSGKVLSVYSSFVPSKASGNSFAADVAPTNAITADVALLKFAESKGLKTTDKLSVKQAGDAITVTGASFAKQEVRASKKYYNNGNSKLVLVWDLSVDMGTEWLNAFVDVASGEIVAVNNWGSDFSDATYSVTPRFQQAPVNGLQRIKSPWDLTASPQGWHVIKGQERNDLAGNNVAAASNPFGSQYQTDDQVAGLDRPSSQSLTFDYQLNDRADPMTPTNINAAVTNMFVAVNTAHDLFYNYGFTESAANFQFDNLGKGGREGDGVLATSQDEFNTNPQSRNNANFLTPPDGQSGRMRMYIFDSTRPGKDGAFDNSIVYHEMAHGLSNRLTGGGSNPNCLPNNFSGGMGEGWSDVMAMVLTLPANANRETNTEMGSYVLGGNRGIRHYPYSTSIQRNPLKFSTLGSDFILATDRRTGQRFREVHNIGEVWTSMLYEVLWNMVDVSGWVAPAELMTSQSSGKGNADFITVVIGGMKLQPCNPNFLQAREAILDAERTLFQGKYKCAIWQGFAKRGMGVRAQTGGNFADSFDAPAECNGAPQSKPPTVLKTTAGSTAGSKTTAGPGPVSSPVKTMITIEVPRPASSRPAPQPTKSAPTTDRPATGSLEGQSCKSFGATQCVGGVTYLCAYYQSFGMTWSKWYSGGC